MNVSPNKYNQFKIFIKDLLLKTEEIFYLLISLGLLIVFCVIIVDGFFILIRLPYTGELSFYIIKFLDKVLISLIVVELFYTVIVAIVEESSIKCIEPFLLVAVTALVRRLLVLTFEIAHPINLSAERLTFYLIEMGLIGVLIIIFVFAVVLFRKFGR